MSVGWRYKCKHSIKQWKINIPFIYNPVDFILHVHSITYLPFYSIQMSEEENVFLLHAIVTTNIGCSMFQFSMWNEEKHVSMVLYTFTQTN